MMPGSKHRHVHINVELRGYIRAISTRTGTQHEQHTAYYMTKPSYLHKYNTYTCNSTPTLQALRTTYTIGCTSASYALHYWMHFSELRQRTGCVKWLTPAEYTSATSSTWMHLRALYQLNWLRILSDSHRLATLRYAMLC